MTAIEIGTGNVAEAGAERETGTARAARTGVVARVAVEAGTGNTGIRPVTVNVAGVRDPARRLIYRCRKRQFRLPLRLIIITNTC